MSKQNESDKAQRTDKGARKKSTKTKKIKTPSSKPTSKSFSLLADQKNVDANLSSLFAAKPVAKQVPTVATAQRSSSVLDEPQVIEPHPTPTDIAIPAEPTTSEQETEVKPRLARKRKRGDQDDDLEDKYMRKLAREADQENAANGITPQHSRLLQQQRKLRVIANDADLDGHEEIDEQEEDSGDFGNDKDNLIETGEEQADGDENDSESNASVDSFVPPRHETQTAASDELEKANRTVFLGNVAVLAITSKTARKQLEQHLMSFSKVVPKKSGSTSATEKRILESIRFRSTPYSPNLPKKAAFARKEVVTATTQSTNAYAVYTTPTYAREAVRHLNGSVVLDRHLRVDSVAHPTPIEHRRCVFVGNLGFVDDESNIVAANEADGREKRKTKQKPSDVEEGLWRLFGKHGTVESVRVVRDKGTRVGKGIAYVQFVDENAVEGALSENDKKDPPMLPRRLRVTRAKAMKRKSAAVIKTDGKEHALGYRRKVTPGEATHKGRIGKLMGKAAAALATNATNFRAPESFVFEGHRAKANQGKAGLKLGKAGPKRKGKPTTRSARRAATFRAGQSKK